MFSRSRVTTAMSAARLTLVARAANRYADGKVYWMGVPGSGDGYVGSTIEPTLGRRKTNHKSKPASRKCAEYFASVGWDNAVMVLLEAYPCSSRDELRARERTWVERLRPTLNTISPYVTAEERTENTRRRLAVWHAANADRWAAMCAAREPCGHCGKRIRRSNMTRHLKCVHSAA